MNNRHNDKDAGRLLYKYVPLFLLQEFEKGYSMVCVWEGAGDQTETAIFWPPTLMAVNIVSFSFSWCSTGGPGPTLLCDGFLYCILSATFLVPKLHRGSRGPPQPGVAFPTTSRLSPYPTLLQLPLASVLTELYISSTPTRSLKSHVWSSSSGNNCHAVQRSLSSGASVYESIMGFFSLSHFVSQFPPTRFLLLTAIGMCHFLPVHHLEWHFGPGRRSIYNRWNWKKKNNYSPERSSLWLRVVAPDRVRSIGQIELFYI